MSPLTIELLALAEAERFERLRAMPHDQVATYLGELAQASLEENMRAWAAGADKGRS